MLLGMITPTYGHVELFGERVRPDATRLWRRVGHLVDTAIAYPELTVRENLDVAIYADSDPNAYFFPTDGPRDVFNISLGRGEFSFPVFYDVPASMPVNVDQFLFVSLPSTLLWDRKAYDNSARSRLRIRRKPSC